MDSEGNSTSAGDWLKMSRVNECAQQLYPYSSISANAWAERAYRRWATEGIAPEYLRDRQSPGLLNLINKSYRGYEQHRSVHFHVPEPFPWNAYTSDAIETRRPGSFGSDGYQGEQPKAVASNV